VIVRVSPNEQGSPRWKALNRVLSRHPDRYEVTWTEPGIDVLFEDIAGFEWKEPADLVSSMFNGHMASQRRQAKKLGVPCYVLVMGSLADVINAIPRTGANGARPAEEISRDANRIIKGAAKLAASNFPVLTPGPHGVAMELMVSIANALEANDIALPGVKAESTQEAMMRCLPRVGPTLSGEMVKAGIRVKLVANLTKKGKDGKITRSDDHIIRDTGVLRMVPGMGPVTAKDVIKELE